MKDKIIKENKKIYIMAMLITVCSIIVGIVIKMPELYFAFPIGSIYSMLFIHMITLQVEKAIKDNKNTINFIGFLIRMGLSILVLLFVVFVSRKYFPNIVKNNIIFTGLGFLNIKISIYLTNKNKK